MTPALFSPDVDDAFEHFVSTAINRADDLYRLDGETMFRRTGGTVETYDESIFTGGRP